MKLTILGSGTSTGVPQLCCDCEVCRSTDPLDHRLRCSALLEADGKEILIDCGPDFREQMLRFHRRGTIDAALLTHQHYDHVGGVDDLRPYCYYKREPRDFPLYCSERVAADLRARMPYSFAEKRYPGVPTFDLRVVRPYEPFAIGELEITPIPATHHQEYHLPVLGFRVGPLAYLTDVKTITTEAIDAIKGVDVLVINALRQTPHPSHMCLAEALEVVGKVAPRRAVLTHISHDLGLAARVTPTLPSGVELAYDGLVIEI